LNSFHQALIIKKTKTLEPKKNVATKENFYRHQEAVMSANSVSAPSGHFALVEFGDV